MSNEREAFERWFDAECPTDAVAVKMHEADAIDYLDAMMPIRFKRYAFDAWQACAERKQREIDALAAQNERLREALEEAQSWNWLEDVPPPSEVIINVDEALSLPASDCLKERDARVLREAADSIAAIDDGDQSAYRHCQEHLRELAAAKERGE